MKPAIEHKLIKLNRDFYHSEAKAFSLTRQHAWKGWDKWWQTVSRRLDKPIKIADIGCGNGRLWQFITSKRPGGFYYFGMDSASNLIRLAPRSQGQAKSKYALVELTNNKLKKLLKVHYFDLVVIFGVLHHLPGQSNRAQLVRHAWASVKPGGWLAFSLWRFGSETAYLNKTVSWNEVEISNDELEAGDYLLKWQQSLNRRYCHHFSAAEIRNLKNLPQVDRTVTYLADGKGGRQNRYVLIRKLDQLVNQTGMTQSDEKVAPS